MPVELLQLPLPAATNRRLPPTEACKLRRSSFRLNLSVDVSAETLSDCTNEAPMTYGTQSSAGASCRACQPDSVEDDHMKLNVEC